MNPRWMNLDADLSVEEQVKARKLLAGGCFRMDGSAKTPQQNTCSILSIE